MKVKPPDVMHYIFCFACRVGYTYEAFHKVHTLYDTSVLYRWTIDNACLACSYVQFDLSALFYIVN